MTNPQLRISELAQEYSILLLSKASGVPEEAIVRLSGENLEITEEVADQLRAIAEVLDVSVLNLFVPISEEKSSIKNSTLEEVAKSRLLTLEKMRLLAKTDLGDSVGQTWCDLHPNDPDCKKNGTK